MKNKSVKTKALIDKRIEEMTKKLPIGRNKGHFGSPVKRSEEKDIIKKLGE